MTSEELVVLQILPAEGKRAGRTEVSCRAEVVSISFGSGLRLGLDAESKSDANAVRDIAVFLARAFLLLGFLFALTFLGGAQYGG